MAKEDRFLFNISPRGITPGWQGNSMKSFLGPGILFYFYHFSSLSFSKCGKQEVRKSKASSLSLRGFHSHLIGLNLVTWPHLAVRDAGKCSLELMTMCQYLGKAWGWRLL